MKSANQIKSLLLQEIDTMVADPNSFARDPARDFTRTRKLPIRDLLLFQISMERDTMNRELLKYFDYRINTPSASAFFQQRKKLLPDTFRTLFIGFNAHFPPTLYREKYIPLAVDGSGFNIFRNPNDPESFYPPNGKAKRGYNEIYLVAAYRILDNMFSDAIITGSRIKNEYAAICNLMDRSATHQGTPLFIADRGFPSFNCFAHAKAQGVSFLIRAKDLYVERLLRDELPSDDEFDITVHRIIVRHNSKKKWQHQDRMEQYRFIDRNTAFDYISPGSTDEYELTLRILRIKVGSNSYENLITNLPAEDFTKEDSKDLYHLRWDEEVSFRELKHVVGAIDFHSKSTENVTLELWARMILYNYCTQISALAVLSKAKKQRKHKYQVNYTMAYHTCMEFLRRKANGPPMPVLSLIKKYILPIRAGREYERNLLAQKPMIFSYRH